MTLKRFVILACVGSALACSGDIEQPGGANGEDPFRMGSGVNGSSPGAGDPGAPGGANGPNAPGGSPTNPGTGAPGGAAPGAVVQPGAKLRRLTLSQYRNSVR